ARRLGHAEQERGSLGDHPRRLPGRDPLGDDPGGVVQAAWEAGLPHGAAAPSLRAEGDGRAEDRGALLDPLHPLRRACAVEREAALMSGARTHLLMVGTRDAWESVSR